MVNLLASQANLTIYWVKAHVGHEFNKRADKLAKAGLHAPWGKHVGLSRAKCKLCYKEWATKKLAPRIPNRPKVQANENVVPNTKHEQDKASA